ncbi:transposase family protein [Deinococcus oregonensis]|uniref:Transposase family protein n=1 Tax=Deinococcus oregonensis TaxID=1805970 RepID=A0ABV6B6M3_9DEIO
MNRKQFRRRTGVSPETFAEMEAVLNEREERKKKAGRPAALSVAEQLLMTLEFWRESRTFAHLGDDWGVHEHGVHRTVESVEAALIASAPFQMPRKRVFKKHSWFTAPWRLMPLRFRVNGQKKQRAWDSGKKKRHTLKFQLLICTVTQRRVGHGHECWGGA